MKKLTVITDATQDGPDSYNWSVTIDCLYGRDEWWSVTDVVRNGVIVPGVVEIVCEQAALGAILDHASYGPGSILTVEDA